ncbi:unnamed protein product [Cylindrotheca closterium]|uniref:Uncharacterized protein n=1 Tax=Cylindrotheca closterium TaxID=2856 RepID=A0AAD2FBW7_9STRA|nr:unnamed protein product [Cylindrotheca closterium]
MNGQQGGDASSQAQQEAQLAYLLNAAGQGGGGFMGGLQGMGGAGRLGLTDSAIEEQILQRASALRAEALMQQQRQHQLGNALAALQQQQSFQQQHQLSALAGMGGMGMQEQEALYARAAALRELGVGGGQGMGGSMGGSMGGGMDRLQQFELNRFEEVERRRQQLNALANLGGGSGARPEGAPSAAELSQDSIRSTSSDVERVPSVAPPAPVPTEKSKEDLRKTPGTVIVPCRARGMPMDHNFKTAYFVISEDAKHGEDLVCSYFACRNGGVKFRYCAYCMAPVAKRNFCRRHDHGMSKLKDGKVPEDDGNQSDSTGASNKKGVDADEPMAAAPLQCLPVSKEADKPKPPQALDLLTSTATSQFLDSNDKKRKKPSDEYKATEVITDADGAEDAPPVGATEGEGSQGLRSISAKRRKLWTELLVRRPRSKDPRHLSAWLNEVLTVSEFEIPLDQIHLMPAPAAEESAAGSGSSDEEKKEKKDKKEKKEKTKEKKDKEKTKEPAKGKESSKPKESKEPKSPKEPKEPKEKSSPGEEPKSKKSKPSEPKPSEKESSSSSDEKSKEEEKKPTDSPEKSPKKSSSSPKKGDDDFAGSFADWRDRKKGKALLKKSTGSLRK